MTALRQRFGALELQEYALAIVVVVLFVVGAILKPDTFPTWDNVRNMLTQASVVGVIAIGMTFVIATGGIDLSVGSVLAAAGVFGGVLVDPDGTTWMFILGAVGFATLLGTVNATSIAFGRVVPFIATLAMFSIGKGLALLLNDKQPVGLLELNGGSFGDPAPVLAALVRHRRDPRDPGLGLRLPRGHDRRLDRAQPLALRPPHRGRRRQPRGGADRGRARYAG